MRRKWVWVIAFWLVQAAVPYVMLAPVMRAEWPSGREWAEMLCDPGYMLAVGGAIVLLTVGQGLFLLPVRKPGMAARGRPLWISMAVAGLGVAVMGAAAVLALLDAAWMQWPKTEDVIEREWLVLGVLVAGWVIATPLLVGFSRQGQVESALSRIAARLFLGTLVETMAIIPLNVMMRKRDDCHCAQGSLWALIGCAAVGWFALGPALLMPLLAKRRRRWHMGHCGACGYDMSGCLSAERCPECGAGWRVR